MELLDQQANSDSTVDDLESARRHLDEHYEQHGRVLNEQAKHTLLHGYETEAERKERQVFEIIQQQQAQGSRAKSHDDDDGLSRTGRAREHKALQEAHISISSQAVSEQLGMCALDMPLGAVFQTSDAKLSEEAERRELEGKIALKRMQRKDAASAARDPAKYKALPVPEQQPLSPPPVAPRNLQTELDEAEKEDQVDRYNREIQARLDAVYAEGGRELSAEAAQALKLRAAQVELEKRRAASKRTQEEQEASAAAKNETAAVPKLAL